MEERWEPRSLTPRNMRASHGLCVLDLAEPVSEPGVRIELTTSSLQVCSADCANPAGREENVGETPRRSTTGPWQRSYPAGRASHDSGPRPVPADRTSSDVEARDAEHSSDFGDVP